jgi:Ca2+-binding EF-hand superfamily protein
MFLRFAAAKTLQKEKSEKAFELMDGGQKGVIVIEDLQRVAAELGEEFTDDELMEMVDFVDMSGEGLLSPKHIFKIARQVNL